MSDWNGSTGKACIDSSPIIAVTGRGLTSYQFGGTTSLIDYTVVCEYDPATDTYKLVQRNGNNVYETTNIKKEKTMNYSTAVFLINKDVRAIKVTYEKDQSETRKATTYLYKTFNKDIKVGDYVVVPTSTRHGMTVCKVSDVDVEIDFDSDVQVKWIVDRVDNSQYTEVLTWEEDAATKIRTAQAHKKREDLRKTLEDSINGALGDIKALPIATMEAK